MKWIYECVKECPLSGVCQRAHVEVVGAPLAGLSNIDSYTKCEYYISCVDAEDKYSCLVKIVDDSWKWLDEDSYYEDDYYDDDEYYYHDIDEEDD